MTKDDAFSAFDPVLAATALADPWAHQRGETPRYVPDDDLLGRLLTIPVAAGSVSESGRFAKAIGAWLAHESRRAGFGSTKCGPARRVRVSCLGTLPSSLSGCPLALPEAYGDAANLRGRYLLAATGFFFLQRDTILHDEPDAFERTIDMIRKLRDTDGHGGYTATALCLVHWDDGAGEQQIAAVNRDPVPEDIAPAQFMDTMIGHILAVTPVVHHVPVRELRERREIALPEPDGSTDDVATSEDERDQF